MPTGMAQACAQCPPTRMLSASTMTAQRQERNRNRPRAGFRPGIALIALLGGPAAQALAATTERVVVNRFSGLAIEGVDPVAYFVDARPELGMEDFEASEAGAV